jgi:hypothetical protein
VLQIFVRRVYGDNPDKPIEMVRISPQVEKTAIRVELSIAGIALHSTR